METKRKKFERDTNVKRSDYRTKKYLKKKQQKTIIQSPNARNHQNFQMKGKLIS